MNKRFYLFVLILLIGCNSQPFEFSEKEQLANVVSKKAAIKISREKGLSMFGSGGGTANGIRMLMLGFQCYKDLDVEESRQLLIECVDIFVQIVNDDDRIHKYFINSRFDPKNVEIEIYMRNSETLDIVCAKTGKFRYYARNQETKLLDKILEETYEEAVEKLAMKEKVAI